MADVTGALHHPFNGKEYTLRMSFGVIAKLQAKHGSDLKGLLIGKTEGTPPFDVMLDAIAESLMKCGQPDDGIADLADDMLSADPELFARLLTTAFPDAVGNGAAPKKKG